MKILFFFVVFLGVFSLLSFYLAIRPVRIISQINPSHYNVPYEKVSFYTKDGLLLKGWFIPSKIKTEETIILLHGYPADKGDILPSRLFLHSTYHLLFFDFRYFGESEGFYTSIGKKEMLDLEAAIDFLGKRGFNKIGIWGFSLGGAVALMTAVHRPEIKGVVAESSYADLYQMTYDYYPYPILKYFLAELTRFWGRLILNMEVKSVSPQNSVKQLSIPILLIHSKEDKVIPYKHSVALAKAAENNPHAEIKTVDNLNHGQFIPNYEALIVDFFNRVFQK